MEITLHNIMRRPSDDVADTLEENLAPEDITTSNLRVALEASITVLHRIMNRLIIDDEDALVDLGHDNVASLLQVLSSRLPPSEVALSLSTSPLLLLALHASTAFTSAYAQATPPGSTPPVPPVGPPPPGEGPAPTDDDVEIPDRVPTPPPQPQPAPNKGKGRAASSAKASAKAPPVSLTPKVVHPYVTRKKRPPPTDAVFRQNSPSAPGHSGLVGVNAFNAAAEEADSPLRVAALSWTKAGHVALTPLPPNTVADLWEDAEDILDTIFPGRDFHAFDIETPYGVLVKNVPCRPSGELLSPIPVAITAALSVGLTADDVHDRSRWMVTPHVLNLPATTTADLLINFKELDDRRIALNVRYVIIAGTRYPISKFVESNKRYVQCRRCWDLGHFASSCTRTPRCVICSSTRHTRDGHFCEVCGVFGVVCQHKKVSCVNCKGTDHISSARSCLAAIVKKGPPSKRGGARPA